MNVLISNAYSAKNSGDGLLVDLSLELLGDAGFALGDAQLIAVDPESFAFRGVSTVPSPAAHSLTGPRRVWEAAAALAGCRPKRLEDLFAEADLRVAVGGGYLRFSRATEATKTRAIHMPQLRAASAIGGPTVLLPQSIGPLRGSPRDLIHHLARVNTVFVRDDRSANEVSGLTNWQRVPDLAVMELGKLRPELAIGETDRIGVVLRSLDWMPEYNGKVQALLAGLGPRALPLLQSQAGSGNDDLEFYRKLGIRPAMTLKQAVTNRAVSSVISVRLHGALQSVLNGVPAIHLSYERKGFGAYQDMGVPDWVHPARGFDPAVVIDQAKDLSTRPQIFWNEVAASFPNLSRARDHVVGVLADFVH